MITLHVSDLISSKFSLTRSLERGAALIEIDHLNKIRSI